MFYSLDPLIKIVPINSKTRKKESCFQSEEKAVLVLSTFGAANVPHVISFDGTVDADTRFEYGENTESYHSCGATINGEFWVFGGKDFNRQV